MIRTRIAPSPTGFPHIGTIYQALFNYSLSKKLSGKFIVRIEDTDRARFVQGSEEVIYQSLDWFGLEEDESPRKGGEHKPYKQSERLSIYHEYAQKLVDNGSAYFSYYKKEEAGVKKDYSKKETLDVNTSDTLQSPPNSVKEMLEQKDWVLRMKVPRDAKIIIKDGIRGEIAFDSNQVTEQVILKSDGYPTYHLAAVVDDYLMGITHVIRAEEWLSSTPKHWLLYEYFQWEKPLFFHTPTLRNPDKSKLSKRHGHTSVEWYRQRGFLPEAILNFLALMGWSHPQEKEIFSMDEFIQLFKLEEVKPVGPIFDLTKLTWMNQQYIQSLSDSELKRRIIEFYDKADDLPGETLDLLIPLLKTRMETLSDFEKLTAVFFGNVGDAQFDEREKKITKSLYQKLAELKVWKHDMIFGTLKEVMQEHDIRMPLIYKIFTGAERGLPLPQTLEILGAEKSLKRLKEVSEK